ncbi:MAG TPA: tetraacyldisaccharide 4'-kinase [Candidatus Koribacter sp.]|jgi:tetraacyldisaccharide 4'-kinase
MNPLSGLFGAGVAVRNAFYDRGVIKQERLQGPVVSVGNLCVGGTGKTPFAKLLGDLLMARGVAFDVLSRGYGRNSTEIKVVDANGAPHEFGDEPLLLAKYFCGKGTFEHVPKVIVGADRHAAGLFAEKQFGPRVHLLDDGFQHRQLARDFDIVLLAPDDAEQVLLPVGRLREPLESLRRADAVVATDAVKLKEFPMLPENVWRVQRDIVLPAEVTPEMRVLAFCGIARPDRFFSDLRHHGIYPVAELTFRDHHRYSERDVGKIRREISSSGAECCVTTIKDKMNLDGLMEQLGPTYAVDLNVKLVDGEAAVTEMLRVIKERRSTRGQK